MADEMQMFGWDDIGYVADDVSFDVLPEGEYTFEVRGIKTQQYQRKNANSTIPDGCNQANVTILCTNDTAQGTLFERMYLYSGGMGRIAAFFKSVGMIAPDTPAGTPFPMGLKAMFDNSVSCTGRCKVTLREYTNKDGKKQQSNNVKFLVPDATQQPQAQMGAYQQPQTTYQPQQQPAYQPQSAPQVPPMAPPPAPQQQFGGFGGSWNFGQQGQQ